MLLGPALIQPVQVPCDFSFVGLCEGLDGASKGNMGWLIRHTCVGDFKLMSCSPVLSPTPVLGRLFVRRYHAIGQVSTLCDPGTE